MTVPPASRTGAPTRDATVVLWFPHLLIDAGARLPDFADLRLHHGLTSFTPEGGHELRHVGDDPIDADEEALVGCEALGRLQVRVCGGLLPSDIGDQSATEISDVLTAGELGVDV